MVCIQAKLKLVTLYRYFSQYNFEKLIQTLVLKQDYNPRPYQPLFRPLFLLLIISANKSVEI